MRHVTAIGLIAGVLGLASSLWIAARLLDLRRTFIEAPFMSPRGGQVQFARFGDGNEAEIHEFTKTTYEDALRRGLPPRAKLEVGFWPEPSSGFWAPLLEDPISVVID